MSVVLWKNCFVYFKFTNLQKRITHNRVEEVLTQEYHKTIPMNFRLIQFSNDTCFENGR